MTPLRCAIYTRKSTEEGLEMAFNSLDAQREACEAYVISQRAEGWRLLPKLYDDGGFSGGSMERPAFKRLLADVQSGLIDVIIVYKVDRLTRSLTDFAKIVDVLDRAGASFVSITQAFNTTSSMGRLTLNVLLSFAQFEREVISERIRDKIAQSKARGIWMGGPVPLGYEVVERKLVPLPAEVAIVQRIFELYLAVPSVRALKERLDHEGIVTKVQQGRSGKRGGTPFGRGALYHLLANPVVIGKLRHKDKVHAGEHPAIIDPLLWQAVQDRLASQAANRTAQASGPDGKLLTGMIRDHVGRVMSPSHCVKAGRRYHYYVSSIAKEMSAGVAEAASVPAVRVTQIHADKAVSHAIMALFERNAVLDMIVPLSLDLSRTEAALAIAQETRDHGLRQAGGGMRSLLRRLSFNMVVGTQTVTASIDRARLIDLLLDRTIELTAPGSLLPLVVPLELRKQGSATRLVLAGTVQPTREPDAKLVNLIVNAELARREIMQAEAPRPSAHQVRLARLAYLSPDMTAAILEGRQPAGMTSRYMLKLAELPMDWSAQRQMLRTVEGPGRALY